MSLSAQKKPEIFTVLASVSDKTGLIDFMRKLEVVQKANGRELTILSTGGTAKALRDAGFDITDVSEYTGYDEMMSGRVKTLHPKVHGGLLGRKGIDDAVMEQYDIKAFDMAVINLYPFEATIAKPDVTHEDAIENIDIGGPAMVRSSAKNHAEVTIVTSPAQYDGVLADLHSHAGKTPLTTRKKLARMAFAHTAHYDTAIAYYLAKKEADEEYEQNG
jgi:phosphoribosylaminoimidazolecarboxamide formyltransferase/IMP cyclohydrolase